MFLFALAPSLAAQSGAGLGTYRVQLAPEVAEERSLLAKRLAAVYRGQLETPVAEDGSFLITLSDAAAQLLGRDALVESLTAAAAPAPPAPPAPAGGKPTVAATSPRIATDATTSLTLGGGNGTYQYDGAGNIKAIGDDTYVYDDKSRLVSAEAGASHSQAYTYDGFCNLLTIVTDGDTQNATRIAANPVTNRMDLTGTNSSGQYYNMRADYDVGGYG